MQITLMHAFLHFNFLSAHLNLLSFSCFAIWHHGKRNFHNEKHFLSCPLDKHNTSVSSFKICIHPACLSPLSGQKKNKEKTKLLAHLTELYNSCFQIGQRANKEERVHAPASNRQSETGYLRHETVAAGTTVNWRWSWEFWFHSHSDCHCACLWINGNR